MHKKLLANQTIYLNKTEGPGNKGSWFVLEETQDTIQALRLHTLNEDRAYVRDFIRGMRSAVGGNSSKHLLDVYSFRAVIKQYNSLPQDFKLECLVKEFPKGSLADLGVEIIDPGDYNW